PLLVGRPLSPLGAQGPRGERSAEALSRTADAALGQAPPLFSATTELVVMNVIVRDDRGGYVEGLPRDAFRLFEDGRRTAIGLFTHQDVPVTMGLVIDGSGSMQAARHRLAYAIARFARAGHPEDELFALVVGDRVTAVLPPERPFTNDPTVLQTAIQHALRSRGRTALWDGIAAGLEYLDRGTHARRALVVMSDGGDNASITAFDEVLRRAQASHAAVYTVGLIDPISLDRRPKTLTRLARESGGDAYFPESYQAAFEALGQVAREIRSAYTIGFPVTAASGDRAYHRLRVEVESEGHRRLQVRTRAGYLGGEPRR
ncbi:MAG: VWA domain-containing protein, partial [Vicinamibacterales bacterium]